VKIIRCRGHPRVVPATRLLDPLREDKCAAVEAVTTSGYEPVFLWYAPYAPHNPYTPEPRYRRTRPSSGVMSTTAPARRSTKLAPTQHLVDGLVGMKDKSRFLKGKGAMPAQTEGRTKPLAACRALLSVDDGIRDILAALETKDPGLNNTVVVFTSDQGVQFGEHNWIPKKVPYEGTIRVPFVIRADGLFAELPSTDASNMVLNNVIPPPGSGRPRSGSPPVSSPTPGGHQHLRSHPTPPTSKA
jgi:hypothetical protein